MGPPERRAARLRYDGVSIEEWSYVTDYMRKMDSLILFVGGKVQEIQSAPWEEDEGESDSSKSSEESPKSMANSSRASARSCDGSIV